MSYYLWSQGLQHNRLPCPSPTPWVTQTQVHQVSDDDIQPSHHLLSPSPPAFHLSQHQGFSNESVLHIRWPEYWSFSFIQRGTKTENMGESLSWERPPKVLLGCILNGFKSLLGEKKNEFLLGSYPGEKYSRVYKNTCLEIGQGSPPCCLSNLLKFRDY